MKLKEKARQIESDIETVYLCMKDYDTPVMAKIMAFMTVCYALSPVDLIPDFIPVLGYLDDAVILPLLITLTIKMIPQSQWQKCKKEAEE